MMPKTGCGSSGQPSQGYANNWQVIPLESEVTRLRKQIDRIERIILAHPELKEIYEQEVIVEKLKGDA